MGLHPLIRGAPPFTAMPTVHILHYSGHVNNGRLHCIHTLGVFVLHCVFMCGLYSSLGLLLDLLVFTDSFSFTEL